MRKTVFIVFVLVGGFLNQLAAQSFTSSNFPIVVINTSGQGIPDEPKITASMGIIDNGPGHRNNLTDAFNIYDGKIGIEQRGSSSRALFPKKQYAVELRDNAGNDISVSLLGLPEEEDWILSAPYNDKSLMRDVLAYKLSRDMGRYAPRTKYCEVVLNGHYDGVYFLNEKIKKDKNRVDIATLNPDEISGNDLTGGYIIKLDKYDGSVGPGFDSEFAPPDADNKQPISFQYEYPKWDEIVPQQKAYIKNYVSLFEKALDGPDYADPDQGYAKYIDVDSFIDFFIMNEITRNVDGYRLSTFLYKQKDSDGGKLFIGPIWDFNLAFGNADYCTGGSPIGFVYSDFNKVCGGDTWLIPFWWNKLMIDANFSQKVSNRWATMRQGKFKTETIHAYIDSVANALNLEAQQRNFQRWPNTMGTYVWPNYFVGPTYQSEVNWLKSWISQRLTWLDDNIPELITGIETSHDRHQGTAFPNPFSETTFVEYELAKPARVRIEVIDHLGRIVDKMETFEDAGKRAFIVGASLAPGSYSYVIRANRIQNSAGRLLKR